MLSFSNVSFNVIDSPVLNASLDQTISNNKSLVTSPNVECDLTPAPFDIPPKTFLKPIYFVLPCGSVFSDQKIPPVFDVNPPILEESFNFPCSYFVDLYDQILSYGTYNFAGARIP